MEPWGYDTAMIADGQVISGDNSGQMHDLAEYFRQEEEGNGQVNIFTFQKATVVEKYIPEQDARLVAAHFPEENWLITSVTSPFSIFLAAVCAAGAVAIAVLLLLAAFFTRRMNRVVLEPVELLVDGAKRIQDGKKRRSIIRARWNLNVYVKALMICSAPFWKIRNSGRKMRKPEPIW